MQMEPQNRHPEFHAFSAKIHDKMAAARFAKFFQEYDRLEAITRLLDKTRPLLTHAAMQGL